MPLNSYKSMGEKYSELNLKMDEITTHLSELLVYPDYKATKTLPSTSEFKANTNCICIEEVRAGSVLYDEIYINGYCIGRYPTDANNQWISHPPFIMNVGDTVAIGSTGIAYERRVRVIPLKIAK